MPPRAQPSRQGDDGAQVPPRETKRKAGCRRLQPPAARHSRAEKARASQQQKAVPGGAEREKGCHTHTAHTHTCDKHVCVCARRQSARRRAPRRTTRGRRSTETQKAPDGAHAPAAAPRGSPPSPPPRRDPAWPRRQTQHTWRRPAKLASPASSGGEAQSLAPIASPCREAEGGPEETGPKTKQAKRKLQPRLPCLPPVCFLLLCSCKNKQNCCSI